MLWLFKLAARVTRWRLRRAGLRMSARDWEGGKLAIYHGGEGRSKPLLVLAHGMGDWVGGWRRVLTRLPGDFEILALDLPGYGYSPRPAGAGPASLGEMGAALRAALEPFVGRPFLLVGQSLGGWVALREAQAGLAGLHHLVLINPAGAPAGDVEAVRRLLIDLTPAGQRRIRKAIYGAHIPWRQYFLAPLYRRARALPGFAGFVKTLENPQLLAPPAAPPAVPLDFIFGTGDGLFGPASRTWFCENFPGARVHLIDCGHAPQVQAPAALAELLRAMEPHASLVTPGRAGG
jgi:pimeloyl-ACP methyl ester carboxylesterase